jgi:hypothetical protein
MGQVEIPDNIKVIKEVTDIREYNNSYIAKHYEKFQNNIN